MWSGSVVAVHIAPRAFLPPQLRESVKLITGRGIEGDRYCNGTGFYSDREELGRQLTFIETEALANIERDYGVTIAPGQHRRNITTEGVPLNHLVGMKFKVGEATVLGTRLSTPCRHIEQITGKEILGPLMHQCGLNACIVEGGIVCIGDVIAPV